MAKYMRAHSWIRIGSQLRRACTNTGRFSSGFVTTAMHETLKILGGDMVDELIGGMKIGWSSKCDWVSGKFSLQKP